MTHSNPLPFGTDVYLLDLRTHGKIVEYTADDDGNPMYVIEYEFMGETFQTFSYPGDIE